jgi:hypothetical protein
MYRSGPLIRPRASPLRGLIIVWEDGSRMDQIIEPVRPARPGIDELGGRLGSVFGRPIVS